MLKRRHHTRHTALAVFVEDACQAGGAILAPYFGNFGGKLLFERIEACPHLLITARVVARPRRNRVTFGPVHQLAE